MLSLSTPETKRQQRSARERSFSPELAPLRALHGRRVEQQAPPAKQAASLPCRTNSC
jgi:hypothetical protein